jgi:uncharacterized protein YjbI with pentapeptide repeats
MRGADATKPSPRGWLGKHTESELPAASNRARRFVPGRTGLLVCLLVALASLALWKVPEWQVAPARSHLAAEYQLTASERLMLDKELFQAENAARGTLALIIGAAGLLLALGVIWRRVEVGREVRSQERFAQAIEQLASERSDGSPRTETRLGGIYALERIAAESEKDYWPVMEVLTAYLRENAARGRADQSAANPRPGADIQAIVGVLGRRRSSLPTGERRLLDLRETDLRGANLSGARLEGVTLQGAKLDGADATRAALSRSNLREAELGGAILSGADLEGAALARANLEGVRLNGADLKGADLSGANLRGVDLWQANLKGCNLKDADLRGADLSQADLQEAILWRADLQDATLTGARLKDTHLERANMSRAVGLTWEQGKDAFTDENTVLPEYLTAGRAVSSAQPSVPLPPPPPPPRPTKPPAARTRRAASPTKTKTQPKRTRSRKPAASAPADNIVQLQEAIRTAARAQPKPKPKSKKLARPRKRRPALVAPA